MNEHPNIDYSEEEKTKIIQYIFELRKDYIVEFLREKGLNRDGTKDDLRNLVNEYLARGQITYADLVNLLDSATPYGKQHVFLYNGPETEINTWRNINTATEILERNNLMQYTDKCLPLILPAAMSLTHIKYEPEQRLSVTAVERRDHLERRHDKDTDIIEDGVKIELHAYVQQVTRGVVIFNWDLVSNMAQLQITQLASGTKYEDVVESFTNLITPWFQLRLFRIIDIGRAIAHLHELEDQRRPEARSHGIGYRTVGGRSVLAQSPTARMSVLGEQAIDNAMRDIRSQGSSGNLGNFYWLPRDANPSNDNPLEKEIHTILVGDKKRINLTTPNRETDINYVLSRVRALSS